jgi:hypothetical protein
MNDFKRINILLVIVSSITLIVLIVGLGWGEILQFKHFIIMTIYAVLAISLYNIFGIEDDE